MTTNARKVELIRQGMERVRGDTLERFNREFGKMTLDQLQEMHGKSGKTRQAIWQEAKEHHADWAAASALLESLVETVPI